MLGDRPSDGKLVPILTPIKSVGTTVSTKGQVRCPCCSRIFGKSRFDMGVLKSLVRVFNRIGAMLNNSTTRLGAGRRDFFKLLDCPYGVLAFRNTCGTETICSLVYIHTSSTCAFS